MDELQSLKAIYPEPSPPADPVVQRDRETLMRLIEEATDIGPTGESEHVRGRRAWKLLLAPPALALLAASGWVVLRHDATQAASFACVADGVTAVLSNDGTSPIDSCRSIWEAGAMHKGVTTAPPLAACVNDGGAVEVITADGPDTCEAAGMGEWAGQPEYEAVGAAVRAARLSFHDRYNATGNGCVTEQDWRTALEDQPGTQAWNIKVNQVKPDRHCFAVGLIDPTTRTITVVGFPGDYSIGCDPRTGNRPHDDQPVGC
jgi:hypothetical protein